MKNTFLIACLSFLFSFLLGSGLLATAQAQTLTWKFGDDINTLDMSGKAHVTVVYDTANFVQQSHSDLIEMMKCCYIKEDSILHIDGQNKDFSFSVHVKKGQLQYINQTDIDSVEWPGDAPITWTTESGMNTITSLMRTMTEALDSILYIYQDERYGNSDDGNDDTPLKRKRKRNYSVGDRTDFDFHWAFNNWGDQWYNGLMKMDGAYNLKTSFSSFQLSENYALVMTPHLKFSLGIGYESDVYKFSDPYVAMGPGGDFATVGATTLDNECGISGTQLDNWSTRLVTRYVTLPVMLQYRDIGILKKFSMSVGVVPGLGFNSRHTGLKHELEQKGKNFQGVDDVSKFINPYKLDVRMTFQVRGIGFFVQVPTMPLFVDNSQKVYPIKIGFFL